MPIQNQTSQIRRVLVRPPVTDDLTAWAAYGWHSEPDPALIADEHAAFRSLLEDAGAEVIRGTTPVPGDPDAIYAYDPALLTDSGVILPWGLGSREGGPSPMPSPRTWCPRGWL